MKTIADIAAAVGVSPSTVSRALAGSPLVAKGTRQKIQEIAADVGFVLNESARNLRRKQTRTIEVILSMDFDSDEHFSDPFFLQLVGAIANALSAAHYDLLLSTSAPWNGDDARASSLASGRADGVIVIGQGPDPKALQDYARANKKVVVWGAHFDGADYVIVGSDNIKGGKLATQQLIAGGAERIIAFGDKDQPEFGQRYRGYQDALSDAGLSFDEDLVVTVPADPAAARARLLEVIQSGLSFDGIFAYSDQLALAALDALTETGVSVPDQVALVGYDDIPAAALAQPGLTTIRQHIKEAGQLLVRSILGLVDGEDIAGTMLSPYLVVRGSTKTVDG